MKTSLYILYIVVMLSFLSCKKENPTDPIQEENSMDAVYKSEESRLLIGACYYPWYRENSHWSGDNIREHLIPAQYPVLGKYDCINQSVISQHVKWSIQAGIDFWISSWWGPGNETDDVIVQGHQTNPDFKKSMGYCILYEPTHGGVPINVDNSYINQFLNDLNYLSEKHFNCSNYLKIDNKPVIYIYLTRTMQGSYKSLLEKSDSLMQTKGFDGIYVVGDEVYWGRFVQTHLPYMEAVTAYNPHISQNWVSDPVSFVSRTKTELYDPWMTISNDNSRAFWIDVLPGFNDLGVRPEAQHPVIPRDSVSTFINFLNAAKTVLKKQNIPLKVLVITSWNEWHEDSQIEPVTDGTAATQKPFELTKGFWYYGYGTSYLNILNKFKQDFNN